MKLLLFAICSICIVNCFAQNNEEQAIRNVMQQQTDAWNKGDIDGFMQTYLKNDSLLFIGAKGVTYGWDSTLVHYKKGYPDKAAMGSLHFELKELKPLSDTYYFVVGKFILDRKSGSQSGFFDLLFKKVDGKWYIISDHTS